MLQKQSHNLIILLLFAWLLPGCRAVTPGVLAVNSPGPVPTASEAAAVSVTPAAPSAANVPSIASTASLTPEMARTQTPVPTLAPSPVVSPTPAPCTDTQGQVLSLQASFDFYSKPLQFQLYLPPCYGDEASAPAGGYPLLILLHGQESDDHQWVRLGAVAAADRLISSNQSVPFIIAMPYEEYSLQDPLDSSFGKLVTQGLLPWIDQHYHTCTQRACRAIGGMSRGAAWAVRLGFTDWKDFGEIGAHSLAYFWGDNVMLRQWTRLIPAGQFPSMYLDIGDADRYLPSATEFEGLLTQYQVPHTWLVNQGEHVEEYWQAHVEEYLRWYSRNWTP